MDLESKADDRVRNVLHRLGKTRLCNELSLSLFHFATFGTFVVKKVLTP